MSPTDTWTARYRGRPEALLVVDGAVVTVPVVRVLKTLVIVTRDGVEMRYAEDACGFDPFNDALRGPRGQLLMGRCPALCLEGDAMARTTREEPEITAQHILDERIRRIDSLLAAGAIDLGIADTATRSARDDARRAGVTLDGAPEPLAIQVAEDASEKEGDR